MRIYFTLLILCLCYARSVAQEAPYFLQSHINGESGLPQNTVRDLYFSKSGFLWIATENGLSRFDGKNIKNFYASKTGLVKNRIGQFIAMNNGKLYCLAEGQYLHEIIESTHETSIRYVRMIQHKGFISYDSFQADSLTDFLKKVQIALPENIGYDGTIFFTLNHKNLIVQRTNAGVTVYSGVTCHPTRSIPISNSIYSTYFVQHDELYCKLPDNEFLHINTETGKLTKVKTGLNYSTKPSSHSSHFNDGKLYWNYKTGHAFFINENALFEVNILKDRINFEKKINELPPYKISTVIYSPDKQSILLGTFTNGFFWYKQKAFDIKLSNSGDNSYYAQTNYKNEAAVFTPIPCQKFFLNRAPQLLKDESINRITLLTDQYNRLWYARSDTVLCKDLISNKVITRFTIPANDGTGIGVLAERDNSSIYVSSNRELFVYSFNGTLKKVSTYPAQKIIERTYTLLKANDSILYIGTDQGLFLLNTNTIHFEHQYLQGISVRSLFITSNGILLAGTYGNGYYVITGQQAIPVPLDKNDNLKSTHCFIEDHHGCLWMPTNNGLYNVKLSEIERFLSTRNNSILHYFRYSHTDGLLTNEFNGGCYPPAVQVDSSIWSLPSMHGLVWFKPDSLSNNTGNSALYIDKIVLNDKLINSSSNEMIQTEHHDFRLEVFVSSPNWTDETNLYIEYAIDPDSNHSDWKLLKNNSTPILLQNLSGGHHTLIIRKQNRDANQEYSQIELSILVPKLLNEYNWFWPLTILVLLMLMYGVAKLATYLISRQKQRLERMVDHKTYELKEALHTLELQHITIKESEASLTKENEIKNTLLFLLSHDIASPLRFINRFLSDVNDKEKAAMLSKEDLVDLTISTQNLEALLDNIVIWIKQTLDSFSEIEIEDFDIQTLVNEKLKLFQLAIRKKNNAILNEIPADLILHSNRFILSMALQNILGNAINFTKQGTIRITCELSPTSYILSVIDSGKSAFRSSGQEDEVLAGFGIGLKITNELLKLINGEIQIEPLKNNEGMKASIYIRKKTT